MTHAETQRWRGDPLRVKVDLVERTGFKPRIAQRILEEVVPV